MLGIQDNRTQKNETGPFSYTIHKKQLKWIIDLNIRPDTTKLLEENMGDKLQDINMAMAFWI